MKVYVVGTCDTKEQELVFAKSIIQAAGVPAVLVDVGTKAEAKAADFPAAQVAAFHPDGPGAVLGKNDRGVAVAAMGLALAAFLKSRNDIGAVLGLGGTGNTTLVTGAMRELPIGVPKLMVSTVASGNTAPYVGPTDMAMMYSVVDIAGLNPISERVIANAARAVAGMVKFAGPLARAAKPGIGMTMFGVTTPCVTEIRKLIGGDYECYVFHATGTGGQSMEKLADSGLVEGLIDATTTEVPDFLFGGVFPCTADRFGAVARTRLPYVGSVGAVDMVNWGARDTVPVRFADRKLHVHNASVTLMRTTPEENRQIGAWIASRLNKCDGPVRFVLPLGGVSMIDALGQPFHDPAADEALFAAIESTLVQTPNRKLVKLPLHINDPAFAAALVTNYRDIAKR
ncbi:MAG: Tm-1-like ATP-binding domain-containing protein [Alphaproteobacteria bacterium]|nr:Tm-1-like ATP-binding domain-containing protein [Alphaproteobacteria bacterium]